MGPLHARVALVEPSDAAHGVEAEHSTPLVSPHVDARILAFINAFGMEFPEPLPEDVAHGIRGLKWHVVAYGIASCAAIGIQVWCVVQGMLLLRKEEFPRTCTPLQFWLSSYCLAIMGLPCFTGCALPLATVLVLAGAALRSRLPTNCQQSAPGSWAFVDEVAARGALSLACASAAAAVVLVMQQRLLEIHRRWGLAGPTHEEVLSRILAGPQPEMGSDAECAICLGDEGGVDEGGLLSDWRVLRCGHKFHEGCLLAWLQRARRCPLCRLDLHVAYTEA